MFFSTFSTLAHGFFALIIGVIGFGVLVGMHELGHFLFCKLFNVSTPSFSIGFGPKLISKKIGDTQFSLGILPIGGYVEIAGNEEIGQGEQTEAKRDDERSFKNKKLWQKLCIMCGGIFTNIAFAYLVIIGLFACGIPATPLLFQHGTTTIKKIIPSSAAERAGLQAGDTILKFDDKPIVDDVQKLGNFLIGRAQSPASLLIERTTGRIEQINIILDSSPDGQNRGIIGTEFETSRATPAKSLSHAISEGIKTGNTFFMSVFVAFKQMFTKRSTAGLGGPLMLLKVTAHGATRGWKIFLLLLAFISMNLAALNLIPLPIFDGGQALLSIIESIVGRQLPDKAKNWIFIVCWAIIIILLILLTVRDIRNIFFWLAGLIK